MSKAEQLATAIDQGNYAMRDLKEVAALLRQQDALLKQALEALETVTRNVYDEECATHLTCAPIIKAIKEYLK